MGYLLIYIYLYDVKLSFLFVLSTLPSPPQEFCFSQNQNLKINTVSVIYYFTRETNENKKKKNEPFDINY